MISEIVSTIMIVLLTAVPLSMLAYWCSSIMDNINHEPLPENWQTIEEDIEGQ